MTTKLDFSRAMGIIPDYSGNPNSLHQFIACCNIVYKPLTTAEEKLEFISLMHVKLKGSAYELLKYNEFTEFESLRKKLESQFLETRTFEQIQTDLINVRQGSKESCVAYGTRVEKLLQDLNEASKQKLTTENKTVIAEVIKLNESTALQAFQQNLREPIKTIVKASRYTTLKNALSCAINEDKLMIPNNNTRGLSFQCFSTKLIPQQHISL